MVDQALSLVQPPGPVAVTGASGYLASWVVRYLLEGGSTVHATVRDPSRTDRVDHLKKVEEGSEGTLKLFAADLLESGSFDEAFEGCATVIHVASPFQVAGITDAQRQLVTPALEGTRSVLASAQGAESVKRVVLTSSVAAMYGDAVEFESMPDGICTPDLWNTTSSLEHQPYSYSKTVAEREAWKITDTQDRFDLVVMNPTFILGPSASSRKDGTSVDFMLSMMGGKMRFGVPELSFGFVDVRDAAIAHILAASTATATGRYILCSGTQTLVEVGKTLHERTGGRYRFPRRKVPKGLLYLVGWIEGMTWPVISKNVGHAVRFESTRSVEDLGLEYRPVYETLMEQIKQIETMGLV